MPQRGDVSKVANQVEGHHALQIGARVGYAVNGVLHLLIAWIALQVAWIASGKSADQSGALQTLAGSSLGRLTLWVAVLGFLALGLWQLASALAVRTGGQSSKWAVKAKGIALAVVGVLFTTAAAQDSSSKATGLDGALRSLRQQQFGPWLLTAVALGIAAFGLYSFARARHARV